MDATMNEQEFVWQMMNERLNKLDTQLDKLLGQMSEQQTTLDQIDEQVHEVKDQQQAMSKDFQKRFSDLESMIKSAVPDGDLEGHRAYHAMMMRRWNWMSTAKTTVLVKVLEVAAIAALVWVAGSMWGGFKVAVGG